MMYIILLNVNTDNTDFYYYTDTVFKKEDKDKFTKNQIIYCTDRYLDLIGFRKT